MPSTPRRRFLKALLGSAAAAGLDRRAFGVTRSPEINLTVDFDRPGSRIPADFLGLSFDARTIAEDDYLVPENEGLVNLVKALSKSGVIRVGGNMSDLPVNSPGEEINRPKLERFAKFVEATGWRLIYGLNLGSGSAEQAAQEAALVNHLVGARLLAFQIGNEPDLYGHNGRRPGDYGVGSYIREWRTFSEAIRAQVPGAPFAGPDTSPDTSWLAPFGRAFNRDLQFLTYHWYPEGPAGSPNVTAARMLNSTGDLVNRSGIVRKAAASVNLPLRMTEMNSITNGGRRGISDTFAATLWVIDSTLTLAAAGWLGVNIHGGKNAVYSPIVAGADGRIETRPIYYGLLFFSRVSRGSICPVLLQEDAASELRAFAIRGEQNERRLVLLNRSRDETQWIRARLDGSEASVQTLEAPSLQSRTEIRLTGGSLTGNETAPNAAGARVTAEDGAFTVALKPATVTLLEIL
ncbi:MAG: hypothetical protein JO069_11635 [Verrucomicrobia bacterium]|nr:hypothetical protein [Verrucomicrobiota bacterium]